MNQNFEKTAEQVAAFQKIWMESMSRMCQAAFTFTPGAPPPEMMRQMRSGIFQVLGESWEQFLRSPEFLDNMKQWMDHAVNFRKLSQDFMAKLRNEWQTPSREDVDAIMLTVRHMEKRLLDRVDALSEQVATLQEQLAEAQARRPASPKRRPARATTRPVRNGKETHS